MNKEDVSRKIDYYIKSIGSRQKFCNLLAEQHVIISEQGIGLWVLKGRIPCKYRLAIQRIGENFSAALALLEYVDSRIERKQWSRIAIPNSPLVKAFNNNSVSEVLHEINEFLPARDQLSYQTVYQWLKQGYIPASWTTKLPINPDCFKSEDEVVNESEDLLS